MALGGEFCVHKSYPFASCAGRILRLLFIANLSLLHSMFGCKGLLPIFGTKIQC
ncbi:hypothetical protein HMPREF0742_02489 [Rothia aeria F0184]|uniref:Uncharacterized protein n=1 Tax=Rothia aeria F0184 TaxID=888019 RepID=U7UZV0_9MICC|nr:hypothetical protein HMPREF0742_02489 [Rothia aeria F0184]